MFPLIETIKIHDGNAYRIQLHQERMNRSWKALYKSACPYHLETILNNISMPEVGTYKFRMVYDADNLEYNISEYVLKEIDSVKLIHSDAIAYQHKFKDRSALDNLYTQKGDADDIVIIKNSHLTDSYYCNIALKKNNTWYTPAHPLLKGTQRADLLNTKKIIPADIKLNDLNQYEQIMFFNAMIEFGESLLPIENVK